MLFCVRVSTSDAMYSKNVIFTNFAYIVLHLSLSSPPTPLSLYGVEVYFPQPLALRMISAASIISTANVIDRIE